MGTDIPNYIFRFTFVLVKPILLVFRRCNGALTVWNNLFSITCTSKNRIEQQIKHLFTESCLQKPSKQARSGMTFCGGIQWRFNRFQRHQTTVSRSGLLRMYRTAVGFTGLGRIWWRVWREAQSTNHRRWIGSETLSDYAGLVRNGSDLGRPENERSNSTTRGHLGRIFTQQSFKICREYFVIYLATLHSGSSSSYMRPWSGKPRFLTH